MRFDQILRSFHQSQVRAEGSDFEAGRVAQVISTGNVVRDGARINPDGWDFTHYRTNPVVLWAHDDTGTFTNGTHGLPVARATEIAIEAGSGDLLATAEFDLEDEFAVRLLSKIRRGFVNATSVRWRPLEAPRYVEVGDERFVEFPRQELLEFSYVTVPADPSALIQRDAGGALDLAALVDEADDDEADDDPPAGDDVPATEAIATAASDLRALIRSAGPGVLTADDHDELRRLYGTLEQVFPRARPDELVAVRRELGGVIRDLAAEMKGALDDLRARQLTPDAVDDLVAARLARFTGRTESSIRQLIEG